MEKLNKNKKRRFTVLIHNYFILIMALALVVVLLAGYFLVLKDQYYNFIKIKKVDLAQLDKTIDNLEQKKEIFAERFNQLISFSGEEEQLLNLFLPDEFDFPSILIQTTELAESHNLIVNKIAINEVGPESIIGNGTGSSELVKKINIEMEVVEAGTISDSYANWKQFISALESSRMFFDLISLNFTQAQPNYSLKLMAYYYSADK